MPSCSKLITANETEMPRSRSTAIQSERVCPARPEFSAGWSALQKSFNSSAGMVFPASYPNDAKGGRARGPHPREKFSECEMVHTAWLSGEI